MHRDWRPNLQGEKTSYKKRRTTGGMQFIASKHCNHGKNSEQLGTKSKSLSTRKRQVSPSVSIKKQKWYMESLT